MTDTTLATTLRTQHETRKGLHPGALVGVEMGAFVEFFFEDAVTVSSALGIVLTKRGRHLGEPIPMTGVPLSCISEYISRLKAAGFAVVVEPNESTAGPQPHSDVEPFDISMLNEDERRAFAKSAYAYEKQRLRAEALHQRLTEHGLGREADVLSVRHFANHPHAGAELDAMEAIVARLELGALPDLLAALRSGAGTDAALRLLTSVQSPESAAAFGERLAVAVICKSDTDGYAFHISQDAGAKLRDAIEGTEENLRNRLELAQEALRRLDDAGIGEAGPLQ